MARDDLLTDRKAHARAVVFESAVQPRERFEDALGVLHFEADPVVGDTEFAVAISYKTSEDAHMGPSVGLIELESVGDEILKQLAHLQGIGVNRGNVPNSMRPFDFATDSSRLSITSLARVPRSTISGIPPRAVTRASCSRASMRVCIPAMLRSIRRK